jgi:hypothetical protein
MKIGDIVQAWGALGGTEVTIEEISGSFATVWWPCPDVRQEDGTVWEGFGRHTKIVRVETLRPTGKTFKGSAPHRTRDHHLDRQIILE